jgi:glycosyltransferase involved in cell wall biosynthesis
MLSIAIAPIAWLKGARYINWLQDIFPEIVTVLGLGQTKFRKRLISILRWLRDLTLRYADANVVLGEHVAVELQKGRVTKEHFFVIPNWANGEQIRPLDRSHNPLRKEWNLQDSFVVGYSGNLGRAHSVETFLSAIAILEEQKTPVAAAIVGEGNWIDGAETSPCSVRWLFIGGGARMKELKREVHAKGYNSVMFHPYQPRERLETSLSTPDVHLISLRPELEGLVVPSKFYGIAAAGRPAIFVGDPYGELARIIRRSKIGFVIREGDGPGLAEAVLTLARDPELAAKQGVRARRLFEREYNLPRAVASWKSLLEAVSGPRRPRLCRRSKTRSSSRLWMARPRGRSNRDVDYPSRAGSA